MIKHTQILEYQRQYLHLTRLEWWDCYNLIYRQKQERIFSVLISDQSRNLVLKKCDLDTNDIDKLTSTESTVLKSSMSINKQCQHTSLMRAVGIKSFMECLILNKLNFYKRLLQNYYTREIITELKAISNDGFAKKINNFLK